MYCMYSSIGDRLLGRVGMRLRWSAVGDRDSERYRLNTWFVNQADRLHQGCSLENWAV